MTGTYEVFGKLALVHGISQPPADAKKSQGISLAIEGDRIADIGPTAEMRRRHKFAGSIGSETAILCPGFVDAHMHSFQIATRGLTGGSSLLEWLKRYIWKWEGSMTREQARACANLAYLEMLQSGTTSFVDYTSVRFADEAFGAARDIGLRGTIGKTMMDRNSPPDLEEDTDASLRETESLIRKWHGSEGGRLRACITPRFSLTSTDALLDGCRGLLERYGRSGVIFTTHAHESRAELAAEKKSSGMGAVRRLGRAGLLGRRSLLAHCVWLTPSDIGLLARSGTNAALCPGSNMMLASGVAPFARMSKAGIAMGLGSDMGAYYSLSMFDQMRLCALMQKVSTLDASAIGHGQVLRMASEGGAKAAGLGLVPTRVPTRSGAPGKVESIGAGTLSIGAKADIVVLDGKGTGFVPENDIPAQIVYSGSPASVVTVICDGRVLMRDGEVLSADSGRIRERASEILLFSAVSKRSRARK